MKDRCRKCRTPKGTPHATTCEVVRHPWAFTDATIYATAFDTSAHGSSDSSSSCDTGSVSDGGGGGDCG